MVLRSVFGRHSSDIQLQKYVDLLLLIWLVHHLIRRLELKSCIVILKVSVEDIALVLVDEQVFNLVKRSCWHDKGLVAVDLHRRGISVSN